MMKMTLITTALLTYVALLNAQPAPNNSPNPLQEIVWNGSEQVGSIDWENHTVVAFGMGKYPHDAVNNPQAKARAKRAALDTAQANVWVVIAALRLDSKTTVGELMNQDRRIKQRVAHWIHEQATVTEDTSSADVYRVTLALTMTGIKNLYAGLLPALLNPR